MWAAAISFFFAGCGAHADIEHELVVVITLDTFRADALGHGDTPALDRFLASARRFPGARTVAPLTLPAHTSMFTGLYPSRHGVHDNAGNPIPPKNERPYPLIAEQFRAAGFKTHALVARAVLAPETGIASGFDTYQWNRQVGADLAQGPYTIAADQVDQAIDVLNARAGKLFLWVHFFDAHEPYRPYAGDESRAATTYAHAARERYRGEIRRLDAALERLFATLPDDALVLVVSDHGEGLGDHDEPTHGPLVFGSTVDAVLAVRGPGWEPGVDNGPRTVCDVAPTLRAACRLGTVVTDGRALHEPPHETVVSESLMGNRMHGWGQCFAVTDGRFTLMEAGQTFVLYDREMDPQEREPMAPEGKPAYERLDRALQRYRESSARGGTDPSVIASVAPYAAPRRPVTSFLSRKENALRPDPAARIEWGHRYHALHSVVSVAAMRHDHSLLQRAIPEVLQIAAEDRLSPLPYATLGLAYRATMQHKEAGQAFAEALERGLRSAAMWRDGLNSARQAKDDATAVRLTEIARRGGFVPTIDAAEELMRAVSRQAVPARAAQEIIRRMVASNADEATQIAAWLR